MRRSEIDILREAVMKVTQILAGTSVKVRLQGVRAYVQTNARTHKIELVNLPCIPDNASPELIRAIQGYLDHEVAHVLFTVWEHYGKATDPAKPKLATLMNIVEDTMIERGMMKRFKGSAYNLDEVWRYIITTFIEPGRQKLDEGDRNAQCGALLVNVLHAWAGRTPHVEYMRDKWHLVEPLTTRLGEDIKARMPNIADTEEGLEVARIIHDRLMSPPEEEEESSGEEGEKCDDGESSDTAGDQDDKTEKDDVGKGDDADEGESDSEETDEGEEPESSDDDETADEKDDGSERGDGEDDDGADGSSDEEDDETEGDEGSGDADDTEAADEDGETDDGSESDDGDGEDADEVAADGGDDDDGEDEAESEARDDEGVSDGDGENADEITVDGGDEDDGDPLEGEVVLEVCEVGGSDMGEMLADEIERLAKAGISSEPWRVFTRDYDRIEPYRQASPYASEQVGHMESAVGHMVGPMQKEIERLLAARNKSVWQPGLRRGRLNGSSLHRLVAGDDRVFRRKEEHKAVDTAVTLLVDLSGSMWQHAKIKVACESAYALSETLDRCRINHEVIGFTTLRYDSRETRRMNQDLRKESAEVGVRYSREDVIYMPIFKPFGTRVTREHRANLADMPLNSAIMRDNVDHECIEIAAKRLAAQREKRKVMIVLSDGMPAFHGDVYAAQRELRTTIEKTEASGIEMIGIGILTDHVRGYYPKSVVIRNVSDLPGAVMGELRKILLI